MPNKEQQVNEEKLENRMEAVSLRTSANGRKCYQILQNAGLPYVGIDEIASSLQSKDAATISSLAEVYDYLFGNDGLYSLDDFRVYTEKDGAVTYWPLEDLYADQYKGAEKSPEEKLQFKKAILVNALAGSGTKVLHKALQIHGLNEIVHGEGSEEFLQSEARRELMNIRQNFSGAALEGYNNVHLDFGVDQIGDMLHQMLEDINAADKWYVRSSESFRTMKENLIALEKQINVTWKQKIADGEPITFDMMNDFLERADALKGDIRNYLNKKQAAVKNDSSRRVDSETYEQRRIQANIKNFEALSRMTKTVESEVLKGISGKARAYFSKDLERLEARRMDLTADDQTEGKWNLYRTIDRQRQLSDSTYTRHDFAEKETLRQARDRILANIEKKYNQEQLQKLEKNTTIEDTVIKCWLEHKRNSPSSNQQVREQYLDQFSKLSRFVPIGDADEYALEVYRNKLSATDGKTLLENSSRNATVVPASLKTGIAFLDELYGFRHQIRPEYLVDKTAAKDRQRKHPQTGRYLTILQDVPHDFKAIYRSDNPEEKVDARLSEKDFVALAICGARTPKSFEMSGRRTELLEEYQQGRLTGEEYEESLRNVNDGLSPENQRLQKCDLYTVAECIEDPFVTDEHCREYLPCVQNGRKLASYAMQAYEKGNLVPLGKLIAFGITDMVAASRGSVPSRVDTPSAEMCKRLSNMLERDKALKDEAIRQGLDPGDLKHIDNLAVQGMIMAKAQYAEELWQRRPDLVTGNTKLNAMADIFLRKYMIASFYEIKQNVLTKSPDFLEAQEAAGRELNEAKESGASAEKVAYLERQNALIGNIQTKKMRFQNKFAEDITKPGAYEKLKKKIIRAISKTELKNMKFSKFTATLGVLGAVKADTGLASMETFLTNYHKQEKNEEGLYKVKDYNAYQGEYYEKSENAKRQFRLDHAAKNQEADELVQKKH